MAYVNVLGRPFFVLDETTADEPYGPLVPLAELEAMGEQSALYRFWGDGACGTPVEDDNPDSPWWVWVALSVEKGSDPYYVNATVRWLAVRGFISHTEDDARVLALEAARLYKEAYELIKDLSPIEIAILRSIPLAINEMSVNTARAAAR